MRKNSPPIQLSKSTVALLALLFCFLIGNCFAEEYPAKPIKIVVGYVPGGSPDFIARTVAQRMSELIKVPVLVENKPGAGGSTAATFVGKSNPDGYTLFLGDTSHLSDLLLKELLPVSSITSEPLLLVASSKSSIKNLQDLIRDAKMHPGEINYGSSGIGSIQHIAMEAFDSEAGLNIIHVPYKGSGQSVPAILAGDVPILMSSYTATASHIKTGSLTLIAVSSAKRFNKYPNVPSLSEVVKDYDYTSETGIMTTAGVPKSVHQTLISIIKRVSEDSQFISKFSDTALSINFVPYPEFSEELKKGLRKYQRTLLKANIPLEAQ
jgi:tripartite-type tricarboxylate transporter receptor subunit TctC